MLRKQTRRSFTVETKHGANQGRATITAKAPRVPRKGAQSANTVLSSVFLEPGAAALAETAKDAAPRRILPSLVTWEPSEPEPDPTLPPEPSLPRVRRLAPSAAIEAPRRRGRPRKVVPEPVDVASVVTDTAPLAPVKALAPPLPARSTRGDRSGTTGLARGERWKRRLPRACW